MSISRCVIRCGAAIYVSKCYCCYNNSSNLAACEKEDRKMTQTIKHLNDNQTAAQYNKFQKSWGGNSLGMILGAISIDCLNTDEFLGLSTIDGMYFYCPTQHTSYVCSAPSGAKETLPTELAGLWMTLVLLSAYGTTEAHAKCYQKLNVAAAKLIGGKYPSFADAWYSICN